MCIDQKRLPDALGPAQTLLVAVVLSLFAKERTPLFCDRVFLVDEAKRLALTYTVLQYGHPETLLIASSYSGCRSLRVDCLRVRTVPCFLRGRQPSSHARSHVERILAFSAGSK